MAECQPARKSNRDGSHVAPIEHLCYSQDVDLIDRLRLAAEGAVDEAADQHDRRLTAAMPACGAAPRPVLKTYSHKGRDIPIYPAAGPGGRRFPLLKAMLTTVCERDCNYCSFRAGRDQRRVTFRPEEMAAAFAEAHRRGLVQGLFLSAGIVTGGINTQERLNATAEILRQRYGFTGYIHLKIMPGAEPDQVRRAMSIASRVSINLEAPNAMRLPTLAPHKSFDDELIPPLRWAETHRQAHAGPTRLASSATQFVVGAAGEADMELLATVEHAYRHFGLSRAFFQSFNPIVGTPLENLPPETPLRQNRLYQASYLLRDYGFDLEDMPLQPDGNLPLYQDPKAAAADADLRLEPIELNQADRWQLLRVPGIGPKSATALTAARRESHLYDLSQLRALGIAAERAAPYITLMGRRPPIQLPLLPF